VRLPQETVCRILHCLVEGNSVRGTARLCGVEKRTVLNMLKLAGENCERLLMEKIRGVRVQDCLELDEIWTYVGCHQKRLTPERVQRGMVGDAYTFICLERSTKLVMAWHLGKRDRVNTEDFVSKMRWATAPGRFDVSTDGFQPYETAIDAGLYDRANHAAVVKMFHTTTDVVPESYRPAKFVSVGKDAISGNPDLDRAGTSHVERKNGTLRQWCKRLTRLTYAFSRSWENLRAALALHFAYYNLCRIHGSLRITPAMAAGISDHVWTLEELIA
jgi:IS1 family transposase